MTNINKGDVMIRYAFVVVVAIMFSACDMTAVPEHVPDNEAVFGTESGLESYTSGFYDQLPSAYVITRDPISDYGAREDVDDFLRPGVYGPSNTGGWNWGQLREINYFLDNNTRENISEDVRNHYNGIARFFRAFFYFQKVKRYGDVPWIDTALDIDDDKLYEGRDARSEVMNNVLDDINYAIDNIQTEQDDSRTRITKDVAYALKSRIALFEGTYRKYHPELGLEDTADEWLQEAASAAQQVMNRGNFSLYQGDPDTYYEELFKTDEPNSAEDILIVRYDEESDLTHDANWYYTSATYGVRLNLIRQFIHTYLDIDGTAYTDNTNYDEALLWEEVQGRDNRLKQTIRTPGYTRIEGSATVEEAPKFSYTQTGYQPHKWVVDDKSYDAFSLSTQSVAIFRYAEVLLNYAEAKAELGTITDEDWRNTIGALRSRAGITGGTNSLPTAVDPYLQSTYFPNINNPVILEVRRERGIELVLENFRFDDLRRWKRGELLEMPWEGMRVESLNAHIDLNRDGSPDVYFHEGNEPQNVQEGVDYINLSGDGWGLTDNSLPANLLWRVDVEREWSEKKYLYPIPESELQLNPNLEQNPGW